MSHPMFERHQELLAQAVTAISARSHWSAYPENPRAYGENAVDNGRVAFEAYRGAQFYLDQPGVVGRGGDEQSPYGLPLNITYPRCDTNALVGAAKSAMNAWIKAGPETRAGVCLDALRRLNATSMEIAYAAMHTTGQAFSLAFQMAGPHAQDRALEAVATAWREMMQIPASARWEKSQGNNPPLVLEKKFTVVPRGVALIIGCAMLPNWSAYPGLFASLVTGNGVIVKPDPNSILPLAMTVAAIRKTFREAGFDPNLVSLLVDQAGSSDLRDIALNPDIRIIDYTGNSEFGAWLEETARQAVVFTQKSSVNCVVVESTSDYKGMLRNLAFAFALYSGQMPMRTQVVLIANEGVRTAEGVVTPEQFGRDLSFALGKLLEDPARAAEILGAVQTSRTRVEVYAAQEGKPEEHILRASHMVNHPQWPEAVLRTPLFLKAAMNDFDVYSQERGGLINYLVQTTTTTVSLAIAERIAKERGSLGLSLYSVNPVVQAMAEEASLRAGVMLSINLTGSLLFNQTAGFSDFHATGMNPAANSCQTDIDFVARRFTIGETRRQV